MPPVDRWAARLARMDRRVDAQMAETVRLVPMAPPGEFSIGRDQTRIPFEIDGLLSVTEERPADIGGRESRVFRGQIVTGRAVFEVRADLLGDREIRKGDRLEAIAQGRVYQVEWCDPIPGRIAVHLTLDKIRTLT